MHEEKGETTTRHRAEPANGTQAQSKVLDEAAARVFYAPKHEPSGNRIWDAVRRAWWLTLFRRRPKFVPMYGVTIGVGSFVAESGEQSVALFCDDVVRARLTPSGAREIAASLIRWADISDENNAKKTFSNPRRVVLQYIVEAMAEATDKASWVAAASDPDKSTGAQP